MKALGTTYELRITAGNPERAQSDRCGVLNLLLQSVWNEVESELCRLICAMGIKDDRVEDVLQDIYLASWQKCPRELANDGLRRWLFRVTVNRCNLEHRRQRRWRVVWANVARIWPIASDPQGAEKAAIADEERCLIRSALDTLPPLQRTILAMRYFSEFNSREIGAILELPDSTVRSHLRLGRQRLASQLRQAGLGDD